MKKKRQNPYPSFAVFHKNTVFYSFINFFNRFYGISKLIDCQFIMSNRRSCNRLLH